MSLDLKARSTIEPHEGLNISPWEARNQGSSLHLPLQRVLLVLRWPNHFHITWSPEPEHPSASSEFRKINHWSHQNRVEDQDDLLTRLQVIYFISTGARRCIFIWVPWLWAVIYLLDLTMRWVCLVPAEEISVWIWRGKELLQRMATGLKGVEPPHSQGAQLSACKIRSKRMEQSYDNS